MSDFDKYQSKMPGVYIEEISAGSNPIVGVGTSTAVFIGNAVGGSDADKNKPKLITSWNEFTESYNESGKSFPANGDPEKYLPYAVYCFFNEGGTRCYVVNLDCPGEAYTFIESGSTTDSFSVQKNPGGNSDAEDLTVTGNPIDETSFTLTVAGTDINSNDPITDEVLTITFDELDVSSYSVDKGIVPPAIRVLLKRSAESSPFPVFPNPLDFGDEDNSEVTFTGTGPSVFVRRKSSTNQDPLSVKLESGASSGYTLTVKTLDKDGKEESSLPIVIIETDGDEFVDLITTVGDPAEIEYKFISGTSPDATSTEFWDLPTKAGCEEKQLDLVFEYLKKVDDINIIAFPDMVVSSDEYAKPYIQLGYEYCYEREYCFFIIDPSQDQKTLPQIEESVRQIGGISLTIEDQLTDVKTEILNKYSAVYFPWIYITNPMYSPYGDTRKTILVPPSGAIAGIYARTDANRGVWKAPAGLSDGRIFSAKDVELKFSEKDYGALNCHNINAIRNIKDTGVCVWGGRTVALFNANDTCDQITQTEWKYINIRRLFNYIEESLYEGNQWVVFEPNGPELWGIVNRNITAFLTDEWKAGAFYGATAEEAFFVKVDKENNPPDLREQGLLIIDVGIAPIYPAEFVIIRISQKMQTE